jgi:6-phosphofructokinase
MTPYNVTLLCACAAVKNIAETANARRSFFIFILMGESIIWLED